MKVLTVSIKSTPKEQSADVSSKRLQNTGIDEKQYELFIQKNAKLLEKRGLSKDEARKAAEETCAMYKHQFRSYK